MRNELDLYGEMDADFFVVVVATAGNLHFLLILFVLKKDLVDVSIHIVGFRIQNDETSSIRETSGIDQLLIRFSITHQTGNFD